MKFAVVTLGSAGDLHPFLAIARALRERGHDVRLLSQEPHREAVEAEGVAFHPIADQRAHDRTQTHPLLWHPLHGFGVLWRHLAVPAIGPTVDALNAWSDNLQGEPLTVLASPLAAGARLTSAARPGSIHLLSGYTAPMALRSVDEPMYLGAWRVPAALPRPVRRWLWQGLDRWKLEPLARTCITDWCQRLSIPAPRTSLFGDWLHSTAGGLALYPKVFAPVPSDWQRRGVRQVGFPLFEAGSGRTTMPGAVSAFLEQPTPYIVAFGGSAARSDDDFVDRVLQASSGIAVRLLLLSGQAQVQESDGPVLRTGMLPLRAVLPRAAAFVHHGGIGSLAQGLADGVPQLVLPSAYDQFENGARLEALSMGAMLPLRTASAKDIGTALQALMRSKAVTTPTGHRSHAGAPNDSVRFACDQLEAHVEGTPAWRVGSPPAHSTQ